MLEESIKKLEDISKKLDCFKTKCYTWGKQIFVKTNRVRSFQGGQDNESREKRAVFLQAGRGI